ncbi:MAG: hypothetical protein LBV70_07010 [Candidatus Adiutrix sp.]|nr:hypothetical protein [Candidatus Adiutrix sp.]
MTRDELVAEIVNPAGIAEADLAVAVVSRLEADRIALPTTKAALGLIRAYPELKAVLINCDNASQDGTREAFFAAAAEVPRIYVSSPPGLTGRGLNIQNAMTMADRLKVRALAVVDANLTSITAAWIKSLFEPLLKQDAEYVSPIYVRHRHEAPLSRRLAYPLLRTLFGRRVLEPVGVDHAFDRRLIKVYKDAVFEADDRGFRSDLKLLALAVMNQARICQSLMLYPRLSAAKTSDSDLPRAFMKAARALFDLMAETWAYWPGISRSRPTALAGAGEEIKNPPPQVEVDQARLAAQFVALGRKQEAAWKRLFSPVPAGNLVRILAAAVRGEAPQVPGDLWRDCLFEASAAGARDEALRDEAVAALAPVFLGRYLAGLTEDQEANARQVNAQVETEALSFETAKPELTALWRRRVGS